MTTCNPTPHSTGRRFHYAHGDLGFSLKLFQIAAEAWTATRFGDLTLPVRFHYASTTLPLRSCYDSTTTMKISLRLVYADGDVAATLLRPCRLSYAFVALLYPFYIESENSDTLLLPPWRFYCALAVSVTIRVILTNILNRSGIAVQWNGGLNQHGKISCSNLYKILCVAHVCKAALELILHDTSFAAYSQSVHDDWVIIYCTTFVNASTFSLDKNILLYL